MRDPIKRKEYLKEYREKNRNLIKEKAKIWRSENKDKIDSYRKKRKDEKSDNWYNLDQQKREAKKVYQRNYYSNNKEKCIESKKRIYNEKYRTRSKKVPLTKEEINKKRRERRKQKMVEDPVYKAHQKIRKTITRSLYSKGYKKTSVTYKILGCSYEYFKEWIESKFIEGMTWENYGKWHYDHIIPIDSATTEDRLIELNHYTNFQPLWAKDNIKKGNKII